MDAESFWQLSKTEREPLLLNQYADFVKNTTQRFNQQYYRQNRDDIANEVVFGLFKANERFVPGRGSFTGFATTIIQRHLYDFFLRAKKKDVSLESVDSDSGSIEFSTDLLENEDFIRKIRSTLSRDPKVLYVFNLLFIEKWTHKEVRTHLGVVKQTVSYYQSRIRELLESSYALKKYLKGESWKRSKVGLSYTPGYFKIIKNLPCCVAGCPKLGRLRGRCSLHYRERYGKLPRYQKSPKWAGSKMVDLQCPVCKGPFRRPPSYVADKHRRGQTVLTCSKKCLGTLKTHKIELTCPVCNDTFFRKPWYVAQQKAKNGSLACSLNCSNILRRQWATFGNRIQNDDTHTSQCDPAFPLLSESLC